MPVRLSEDESIDEFYNEKKKSFWKDSMRWMPKRN